MRRSLEELLVHFHTYRIYAGLGGPGETDKRDLAWAMAGARRTVRRGRSRAARTLGAQFLSGEGMRDTPTAARSVRSGCARW